MAKRVNDIMLDDNYDLQIVGGDLVVAESTRQHQALLLLTEPGQIDQYPTAGIGIMGWLLDDDSDTNTLRHAIESQFKADGMRIEKLDLTQLPTVKITAVYE